MSLNGQPQMPQHYKPNQIAPQFVAQGGFQPPIPPNNNRFAKDFGNGAPSMAKGMRMGGKGGTLAQTLCNVRSVFVKQKFSCQEVVCPACQVENTYTIFEGSGVPMNLEKGEPLLVAQEKSSCICRYCTPVWLRPFNMVIHQPGDETQIHMQFDKPCKWTCLMLNRPEMVVKVGPAGQPNTIGRIYEPFKCCGNKNKLIFEIQDPVGGVLYSLIVNLCAPAVCMPKCGCAMCENMKIEVLSKTTADPMPMLKKGKKSCFRNMCGDADNYCVNFPDKAPWEHRALLIAAAIFIDYRLFERSHGVNR